MAAPPDTQFGKYKLLAKIAAGGMAIAYRAEMVGAAGVKKRVVLKVIHPHLAKEQNFTSMFISEAKVAASLTHGNIAQVFDFGQIDGRYYLSMEEVIGQPVSKVVKVAREKGYARLPVPLALQIIAGVLDGLHYAHTRKDEGGRALNLVHRDVTPDNVLLSYEGEVKVVDFGIAKTTYSVDQTQAGMVRGKYPYLSPEQAGGNRDLDARTDIWAAGVQLFDLLCGRRPYEGEFLAVMREIVGPSPVPSPRSFVPGMDPELEGLVLGALKKDRATRYATAREFSLALTGYLHQKFPASTRQDVQFLLATLFPSEVAKEGGDVAVPLEFAQTLNAANAAGAPPSRGPPPPPVPTEPPVQAAGGLPRVTPAVPATVPAARTLDEDDGDEATSAGEELDEATRGLPSSDDEATQSSPAAVPPRASPRGAEKALASKKSDTSKRALRSKPPPEPTRAAEAPVEVEVEQEDRGPRTQPGLPGLPQPPSSPPPAPSPKRAGAPRATTQNVTRERSVTTSELLAKDIGRAPQRVSLFLGLSSLFVAVLAIAGFAVWKNMPQVEPPKTTQVQLWLKSSPPGGVAKVDGRSVGRTPTGAMVDPGPHTVEVELAGYAPWSKSLDAAGVEPVSLEAELELLGPDAGDAAPSGPDAGAAEAAPGQAGVGTDAAHFARWPKRFVTLRPAKMAMGLDDYATLRVELNPKSGYAISTQGSVSLGPGKATSAVFYFLEGEAPAALRMGLVTPSPKTIRGASAVRLFAIDDSLEDNAGSLRVSLRVSQYVPEKVVTFDAKKHAVVLKPEHAFRITELSPDTSYLVFSLLDAPALAEGKEGKATHVMCLGEGKRPLPLSRAAHFIPLGERVTLKDLTTLECTFFDDKLSDNSGSVELDIVDAAKAAAEGIDPKRYAPAGRY